MEVIQQRLGQARSPSQDLGLGATEQVQAIQQARTGKAAQETGPAISALGERQAAQQAQQALGQVAQQGRLLGQQQQQQAQAQQQAADIQARQLEEQRAAFRQDAQERISNLEINYRQALEEGDFQQAQAAADQASTLARLGTSQYVNDIQMEGRKNRLETDINFKKAFRDQQYADMQQFLDSDLEFKELINADQREFQEKLNNLDVIAAMDIMNAQMAGESQRAKYEGLSRIVSGGIAAGASMASAPAPSAPGGK